MIMWITSIFSLTCLILAYRYYRKGYRYAGYPSTKSLVVMEHIYKKPLIVQDEFIYSTYQFNIIGSLYHNQVMRESAHRLIEKVLETGSIEVSEEPIDPVNKRIRLKLIILQ
jgi:hypothetical protein